MWKIELPYKPGETVYIASRTHLGEWFTEKCEVSHYIIKSENDVSVALRTTQASRFRFHAVNEVYATEGAVKQYIESKTTSGAVK